MTSYNKCAHKKYCFYVNEIFIEVSTGTSTKCRWSFSENYDSGKDVTGHAPYFSSRKLGDMVFMARRIGNFDGDVKVYTNMYGMRWKNIC